MEPYVPQTALEKLNELYQSGFITEWEYNNRKKELGEDDSTVPTINSNSNNDYNSSNSTYDYNQVTPVTYEYNNNNSTSYDHNNNNTSSTYDYNQVTPVSYDYNNNTNTTTSYDYNQVIPIINNDFQHSHDYNNDNNYNSTTTSSYDYNQVTPITYDYNTPTTTTNNYNNDNYNNELNAAANERYDYYSNIEQTINTVNSNNYHSYESVIEEKSIAEPPKVVVEPLPKKSFVLPNKHINKEIESKVREYPLKVLNGYTMHKELGNNIILYYKDKQGNYQSDPIPLQGKSKEFIKFKIHEFIGLGETIHSIIKVYEIILDEKRTTIDINDYCSENFKLSKVLKHVNHQSDEILKPAHLLITFGSMGLHRSRWNPNSKFTSSLDFTSVLDPFKGVKAEPIKIDRIKNPYIIDQFYPSGHLCAKYKFTGVPFTVDTDQVTPKSISCDYKADVHKDALWFKLNFLLLFRFLQNGSNKYGDLSLSNNSVVNILEPLKNSVACSKCIVCNEPSCFSSFLCTTHYSKHLVDAFENCKDHIFSDQQQRDHESHKLEIKKEAEEKQVQYKNETVFIKEKFAYIDPVNLLSIIKKSKIVPKYNFDE